jgi:hypothetical protein
MGGRLSVNPLSSTNLITRTKPKDKNDAVNLTCLIMPRYVPSLQLLPVATAAVGRPAEYATGAGRGSDESSRFTSDGR